MKGLPICFSEVQVKNDVTDNNNKHFVTAFEGECRNIIELREHLKLCFLIILARCLSHYSQGSNPSRAWGKVAWFPQSLITGKSHFSLNVAEEVTIYDNQSPNSCPNPLTGISVGQVYWVSSFLLPI